LLLVQFSCSAQSIGYFQILTFLKHLKELVQKLKREQNLTNQFQKQVKLQRLLFGPVKMHSNFGSNLKLEQSGYGWFSTNCPC
jgi:5-formaminoimidazole-4-carboxamide-1-beta-D-ribofuranosyl 5'-monophosphate synthetase